MPTVLTRTSSFVLVVLDPFHFKAADPVFSLCRSLGSFENTICLLGGIVWVKLVIAGCGRLAKGEVTGRVFVGI
jgi:hypothetical protein